MLGQHIDVDGQHGFVELVDAMQMHPVAKTTRSARVSYAKDRNESTEQRDAKLMRSLARDHHWSPFRHSPVTLHVSAPEFIARQWYKHVVGAAYSFVDTGWNEVSQRYTEVHDVYTPPSFHVQSKVNHQGAAEVHAQSDDLRKIYEHNIVNALKAYDLLIANGVAREEARMILPLSIYTRFYWTATQQALWNFVSLRKAPGAQSAIQVYATAVEVICRAHYGDAWTALEEQQ